MGWLQRLFGEDKPKSNRTVSQVPANAQRGNTRAAEASPASSKSSSTQSVPPERMGLNGEYDQSGLAKRVALAFDEDPQLDDIETLYVAQTGSTVVLKGEAPSRQILDRMVSVAKNVRGATAVETNQVTVG